MTVITFAGLVIESNDSSAVFSAIQVVLQPMRSVGSGIRQLPDTPVNDPAVAEHDLRIQDEPSLHNNGMLHHNIEQGHANGLFHASQLEKGPRIADPPAGGPQLPESFRFHQVAPASVLP